MKSTNFFPALLIFVFLSSGCNGGGAGGSGSLEVGDIEGPGQVAETTSMEYSIEASGGTGITYQWAVAPSTAGTIENPTSSTMIFTAGLVESHITVEIIVTVNSDNGGPEIKTREIEIREVGDLVVENIDGPPSVDELQTGLFSVSAFGDQGITYQWECIPSAIGTITRPTSDSTLFKAETVNINTDVEIRVTVDSSNFSPVTRIRVIQVNEVEALTASEIEGPSRTNEYHPQEYSVTAYGDSGISYQWSCDPPGLGTIINATEPTCILETAKVTEDSSVNLIVTVGSDNYSSEIRTHEVMVRNVPEYGFARSWGGVEYDDGSSVVVDGFGNIYVAGTFNGLYWEVDLDPGPGEAWYMSDYADCFLSKFDSAGNFLWAITWGGESTDSCEGIAVDDQWNIYVTGYYFGTVDFDPGPGVDSHISNGSYDCYLAKYNPDGSLVWAKTWGGVYSDRVIDIDIDETGNIYVTGSFSAYFGGVDFDPGSGTDERISNGYEDIFLSKFDTSGNFYWVNAWGGVNFDKPSAVAVDASGDVLVTGIFVDNVDMDPGAGVDIRDSNGLDDIFLTRFDSDGNYMLARCWGGFHSDSSADLAVDNWGNIYTVGTFYGYVDFNPNPGVDGYDADESGNCFLTRLDQFGNYGWTHAWGGSEPYSQAYSDNVIVDNVGDVYISGRYENTVDFDPGPDTDFRTSDNYSDTFLVKLDTDGAYRWALTWGGPQRNYCSESVIDPLGNIYFTGAFSVTVDFDPGLGVDEFASNGYYDAYLLKFVGED